MRSYRDPLATPWQPLLEDPATIINWRAILADRGQFDVHRLDDWTVAASLRDSTAGVGVGLLRQDEVTLRPIRKAPPARQESSEPPPQKKQPPVRVRSKAPPPAQEQTHAHVNQDQQAATLKMAARDGVPFCEECEKARQQRQAQAGVATA